MAAGVVIAGAIHLDMKRQTVDLAQKIEQLEEGLAPQAEIQALVRELVRLTERRLRTENIVERLETNRVDVTALDRALTDAAAAAAVSLEEAKWRGLDVSITLRANSPEAVVLFAERCGEDPGLDSVEVRGQNEEAPPERFVVDARWVDAPGGP